MDKQREAFEAWYEAFSLPAESDWIRREKDDAEEYFYANTHFAWSAWNAGQQQLLLNSKEQKHVLKVECEPDYWSNGHFYEGSKPYINRADIQQLKIGTKLYLKPFFELNDGAQQTMLQPQWQPIETAPRDETPILAYAKSVFGVVDISEMFFVDGDWYWFRDGEVPDAQPTHWIPLPPEPEK